MRMSRTRPRLRIFCPWRSFTIKAPVLWRDRCLPTDPGITPRWSRATDLSNWEDRGDGISRWGPLSLFTAGNNLGVKDVSTFKVFASRKGVSSGAGDVYVQSL